MRTVLVAVVLAVLVALVFARTPAKPVAKPEDQLAKTISSAVLGFTIDIESNKAEIKAQLVGEAQQLESLAAKIPITDDESKNVRDSVLLLAAQARRMTHHIGAKMLESVVNRTLITKVEKQSDSDAEFWPAVKIGVSVGSLGANLINGVGTYSTSIGKAGGFVSNKVGNWLDNRGYSRVAGAARSVGNGLQATSKFIAPMENKLAAKLAPIKNNQTFQNTRRALNVADAALSISSIAKNVYSGYKGVTALPGIARQGFNAAKNGVGAFMAAKTIVGGIRGTGYQAPRPAAGGRAGSARA